jgi:CBS domain-containing protein
MTESLIAPLTAGALMTLDVATVPATASLQVAIRLMLDRHVSGLPVLDGSGALTGILTEGDLLRRVELGTEAHHSGWMQFLLGPNRLANDYVNTHSRVVGDIMTTPVLTVDAAAPLSEVVALMESKHVKRVPVVAGNRLVGVVSRSDLLRTLAAELAPESVGMQSDITIRRNVVAELTRQSWAPGCGVKVSVSGGVVDLDGVIFAEAERTALKVVAANVPGVTKVVDHLTWIEPNSGMTVPPP